MERESLRSKAYESLEEEAKGQVRSVIGGILDTPKKKAIAFTTFIIGTVLGAFWNAIWGLVLAFSAAMPPLLTVIIIASIVVGLGVLTVAIGEMFFSHQLHADTASDALTELFVEELEDHELEYYDRIKGGSKAYQQVSEDYKRVVSNLFSKRSLSLGVNLMEAIEMASGKKFTADCNQAEYFLKTLYEKYESGEAFLEDGFSEDQIEEIQGLFKDHVSVKRSGEVKLRENRDLIEGLNVEKDVLFANKFSSETREFKVHSKVSNDPRNDYKPSKLVELAKQAVNHLKVQAMVERGNVGSILYSEDSPFSIAEMNEANRFLEVIHADYSQLKKRSRVTDIYQIFAGRGEEPDSATIDTIYVMLNAVTHNTLRRSLPTDKVFTDDSQAMKDFIDDYKTKGCSFSEALNIVQCFGYLLKPLLKDSGRVHSAHADDMSHPAEAQEEAIESRGRRNIYEDGEEEGDQEGPHL